MPEQEENIEFDEEVEVEENLKDKLKKVKVDLKACLSLRQEYLTGWQRAKADFINAQKEHEEKVKVAHLYAAETLIDKLLPVLDSFDMAVSDKKIWEKVDKTWRDGVLQIHSQLLSVLEESGLHRFDPTGKSYDPSEHDCIETIETDQEKKDNIIVEVLHNGYKLHDKIIRPAKVKIAQYKK